MSAESVVATPPASSDRAGVLRTVALVLSILLVIGVLFWTICTFPFGWVVAGIVVPLYFLPTILAAFLNHRMLLEIYIVNWLVGVTGVGWIATLAWAVWPDSEKK